MRRYPFVFFVLLVIFHPPINSFPGNDHAALPSLSDIHAYHVTFTSAEFGATVSTGGVLTSAWFEFGIDTAYGRSTQTQSSSDLNWIVRTGPKELLESTIYHFRAVAENEEGRTYGPDREFITSPPSVKTLPPDTMTEHGATLRAECNPQGQKTEIYFLIGVESTYTYLSTESVLLPADTNARLVSLPIDQLTADSKYYVWAVARNVLYSDVFIQGAAQTFQTLYDSEAAGIIIPLTITNAQGKSCRLSFGVHTSASSRLDPSLGEHELPPPPPGSDAFWAKFSGPLLGQGCDRDYKLYNSDTQSDRFEVVFEPGTGGVPLELAWGVMDSLFDQAIIIRGSEDTLNMIGEEKVQISDSSFDHFRIITYGPHPIRHLPNAVGNSPGKITSTSVELSSSFIPNGEGTFVWYQWGTSREYGKSTLPECIGDSVKMVTIYKTLDGLIPGTVYHIRSVAENSTGISFGMDDILRTADLTEVERDNARPVEFTLYQNYPNPFNLGTTIEYGLPAMAHTTLTMYDVLGRIVLLLSEGLESGGRHRVVVNIGTLSTGVYYYELRAGKFKARRSMVFVK